MGLMDALNNVDLEWLHRPLSGREPPRHKAFADIEAEEKAKLPYDEWDYDLNDVNKMGFTVNNLKGLDFATRETVDPFVQDIRNLGYAGNSGGWTPALANDGTNCTRIAGVNLQGTDYEGIRNMGTGIRLTLGLMQPSDYSEALLVPKAKELGDVFVPKDINYPWQPGDAEAWNNSHMQYRTENGGRIQTSTLANGIIETDNPNALGRYQGVPGYVVRLGKYPVNNSPKKRDEMLEKTYDNDMIGYDFKGLNQGNIAGELLKDERYSRELREKIYEFYKKMRDKNKIRGE